MKKVISVICAVTLLFALCVPVFTVSAELSPEGQVKHNVTVKADDATKGKVEKEVLANGDIKAIATPEANEQFYGWTIKGDKYTIISGTVSSKEIVIRPESDVELTASFTKTQASEGDNSSTAPETNDVGFAGAIVAVAAAAVCAVILKKRAFN